MKRTDINAIEQLLSRLPVKLKKYFANQLLGQINAQADTLIETARPHPLCLHCGNEHPVKWGHSGGLQRYRCHNPVCHKTFNTFRWRHRFLASAAKTNANALSGIIEVDETWFLESCKGKRRLTHRMARKRGGQGSKKKKADKVQVVIVRDRNGHISDLVGPMLSKSAVHAFLKPIIDHDSILCSDGHSWYKTFSAEHDIAHHRLITLDHQRVIGREYHIQNVNGYISRLKGWIARFRGVGTAYLPN